MNVGEVRAGGQTIPEGADRTVPAIDRTETPGSEERLLRVLDDRRGQIEQSGIVPRLDRSPATVSRSLPNLQTDGRVVRYRIGGEKVVLLPDRVRVETRSPLVT